MTAHKNNITAEPTGYIAFDWNTRMAFWLPEGVSPESIGLKQTSPKLNKNLYCAEIAK